MPGLVIPGIVDAGEPWPECSGLTHPRALKLRNERSTVRWETSSVISVACRAMQKPANRRSGVGVSVLFRQADGFEGVIPFEVGVNAGRLPVSLLMQMGYLGLEGDAASAPLPFGVQQH